jgi:Ser/Thr protein kinase RdoA (MazF antagonist)
LDQLLLAFGLDPQDYELKKFGSGHINHTFLLHSSAGKRSYILQKINTFVFKKPEDIALNLDKTAQFLASHYPGYLFISPEKTLSGENMLVVDGEYWRLSPFIPDSFSVNEASEPDQSFEAARQFGILTKNLHGMDVSGLNPSIPGFHDLDWRFRQFKEAINNASEQRRHDAERLIDAYSSKEHLVKKYLEIINDPDYPDRMIHHDTKINNVLFDKNTGKGLCVCDLDTLMPGKIISDLGDMVRTYVCAETEESTDFDKIIVREPYFEALMEGYLSEMKDLLTASEKSSLFYSGQFMIYMQGLRFLSDYLNDDIYYPTKYPEHNLNRAKNQLILLEDLERKKVELEEVIEGIVG